MEKNRILFLCTGNYYRSRFAEIFFNHHALQRGLEWIADSRALAIEKGGGNIGPMSVFTRAGLVARSIPIPHPERPPRGCLDTDLASAARVVAVKEAEHRAYVLQKFPHFADRITYWHVHDLDMALPEDAIFQLEQHIMQLLDELACEKTEASGRQSGRFSPG